MRKEIWELGGSVMEGGEKQEERKKITKERQGGVIECVDLGGGGVAGWLMGGA